MRLHAREASLGRSRPVVGGLVAVVLALGLGRLAATRPLLAFSSLAGIAVGLLVAHRQLGLLVPLTTAALAVGSSIFPFADSRLVFVAKFAIMGAVGATAFARLLEPPSRERRIPTGFALAFLGLVGAAFLSATYSVARPETVLRAASLLLLWLAVAVAVPLGLERPEALVRLLRGIGFVAAAIVVAGFVLTAAGGFDGFLYGGRFQGVLANPNTLGYLVAPILPALLLLWAHTEDPVARRWSVIAAAIVIIGLALSASRAGLLSSAVGTAVGLAAGRRRSRVLVVVLLAAAAVMAVLVAREEPVRPRGEGVLEVGTGGGRTVAWTDALRLISERPLTGHGFAATPVFYPEARHWGVRLGRLHNSYLETALDLGWLGAGLLLWLVLSGARAAWRVSRRRDEWGAVGAALLAGIAGGATEGLLESGLLAAGGLLAFHFWLVVSAAHSIEARTRSSRAARESG